MLRAHPKGRAEGEELGEVAAGQTVGSHVGSAVQVSNHHPTGRANAREETSVRRVREQKRMRGDQVGRACSIVAEDKGGSKRVSF
jgi:hypothetical protein